jgi:PAS domain S-box-containing protein
MINELLQEQISNFFPAGEKIDGRFRAFFEAVSDKYDELQDYIESEMEEQEEVLSVFSFPTSRKRFRKLIENSQDGIALLGSENKLIYVSPSLSRILGYSITELLATEKGLLIHTDDEIRVRELLGELRKRPAETVYSTFRIKHILGSWRWLSTNITNFLHDEDIKALVFNFQDVTEKVEAEQQLLQERINYEALINSSDDLMWTVDKQYNLLAANTAFLERVYKSKGFLPESGSSLLRIEYYSPEEIRNWSGWYNRALGGESFSLEWAQEEKSGAWAQISFYPIYENRKIIGASCFLHDISKRKSAELMVAKSEMMMAEAQSIAHFGSWELIVREENEYDVSWSDEIYRILGLEPGSLKPDMDLLIKMIHPEDREVVLSSIHDSITLGDKLFIDYRIHDKKNKELKWLRAAARVIYNAATGLPEKMVGTVQDITLQKMIEEERTEMAKELYKRNKDLEQFTYIISHNLRAPVANIRGLVSIVKGQELDDASYQKCLNGLESSVTRLDEVIIDLNSILQAKQGLSEKKSTVSFSDIVDKVKVDNAQLIATENVTITNDFSRVDQIVSVKSYIHSIFYNLIINSIKYRNADVAPQIKMFSFISEGKIQIVFSDNGMGIDLSQNKEKIFGLYKRFHTHVDGKGIGLFMVKTQLETLGGTIEVESEPGKGTTFRIAIPIS